MTFKEWLICEMGDIASRDTSTIQLKPNTDKTRYLYNFNHKGYTFEVEFNLTNAEFLRNNIPFWQISFKGPNGYYLTGRAGFAATAIYTQVLLAIKKLFETTQVNGLHFSPGEPVMRLMYDKFFKTYLSNDFMQIDINYYLRKTTLKELMKDSDEKEKLKTYKDILQNRRYTQQTTKEIKKARQRKLLTKKMVGNFVYFGEEKISYIVNITGEVVELYYISKRDTKKAYVDSVNINTNDLNFDQVPSQEEIKQALIAFANSPDIATNLTNDLENRMRQHGIQIRDFDKEIKEHLNTFIYDSYNNVIYLINIRAKYLGQSYKGNPLFIDYHSIPSLDFIKNPDNPKEVSQERIKDLLEDIVNNDLNHDIKTWLKSEESKPLHDWLKQFGLEYKPATASLNFNDDSPIYPEY